jgi:predicted nucleic acid-binding protein
VSGFVVIDASLAVKWLVEEEDSDKAHALLESWVAQDVTRIAPFLMPFEVANVLHRRILRGEFSISEGALMMTRLLGSRLQFHQSPNLHVRAIELASRFNQGAVYDAHYVALAEEFGCDLWTADRRFHRIVGPTIENLHWIGEYSVR